MANYIIDGKVKMSPETLAYEHRTRHPKSHFFDVDTLKFFGERMSEMRVLQNTEEVNGHKCFVLSSVQRPMERMKYRVYHYFDTETFDEVIKID